MPILTIEQFRKQALKFISCNCGGPEDGTGHSPNCDLVLADDLVDGDYKEYLLNEQWRARGG